jgi:hypothetical protein
LLLAVTPVIAAEGSSAGPIGVAVQEGDNTAWAGWIDVADDHVPFRSVAATFTVPTVTCTGSGAAVALWAGLDGYPHGNPTIEQVGIAANCATNLIRGIYPTYFAWYQMGPDGPVFRNAVHPGDTISVSVYDDSGAGRYELRLADAQTPSADIRASLPCPSGSVCHNVSAEVIAEDPSGGYMAGSRLANFGEADFRDITMTSADGTTGALRPNSHWYVDAQSMVNASDNLVAEPSGRSDGDTACSVTYTPDLV